MGKKVLFALLLAGMIFSCKLPNSSTASSKSIMEKYPYWNVEIKFEDAFEEGNRVEAVKAMALMKLIVNTPEFEDFLVGYTGKVYSHWGGSVNGGEWNIPEDKKSTMDLNRKRLVEVIRNANFTSNYIVKKEVDWGIYGDMGTEVSYAFYGYKNPYHTGANVYLPRNKWSGSWFDLPCAAGFIFHEHMHNIGYYHIEGDGGVPYLLGDWIWKDIGPRIISGDLNGKYGKDLEELTNFLLEKYGLDGVATTVDNSRSYTPSAEKVVMTCSHNHH